MTAPIVVLVAWLVFAGSHVLLGFPPTRDILVRRLGDRRFVALFSAVAALGLALLAWVVAQWGAEGPVGLRLAEQPLPRALLTIIALAGLGLAMAALGAYPRSPMALLRTQVHPPIGIQKITRHGFFLGFGVFAAAHAMLAANLAQCLYFAGFSVLSLVGILWQDRKLVSRHGRAYVEYMAVTSILPGLALARGLQRLDRSDRLPRSGLTATALTLLLLAAHPLWSAWNGAPFAAILALGGAYVALRRWMFTRPR